MILMNIKRPPCIELESAVAVIDGKLGKLLPRRVVGVAEVVGGRVVSVPVRVRVLLYHLRKFLTSCKFPTFVIYVFEVAPLRCVVTSLLNVKGVTRHSPLIDG